MVLAAAAYSTVELLILLLSSDTAAVVVVIVIGTHGLPDVNLIGLFKRKISLPYFLKKYEK
jgi:hypothetical protein